MPWRVGAALLASVLIVVAGAAILGGSGQRWGQAGADRRVISAAPDKVAVVDGDTLRLGGVVVRLSGVAGLPRGEACAAGPDCGGKAVAVLASLVRDQRVECRVSGHDAMGRPAGRCDAGGQDVNVALVAGGWARASNAVLDPAEDDAKAHRRGIWLSN